MVCKSHYLVGHNNIFYGKSKISCSQHEFTVRRLQQLIGKCDSSTHVTYTGLSKTFVKLNYELL